MSRWVLVTRGAAELAGLSETLARRGVVLAPFPVLEESPVDDPDGWLRAQEMREKIRFLALTSPRAVAAAVGAAERCGLRSLLSDLPVAAVGARTALAARQLGLRVDIESRGGGRDLAAAVGRQARPGDLVLHTCGRDHRHELAAALSALGIGVVSVIVYRMDTVPPERLPRLPDGDPAAVLLTSPRAAAAYLEARAGVPLPCPHFAMGETTAAEARARGLAARSLARPELDAFEEELWQIFS